MEGRLKEKVPASVAHLVQRFGPVLSASALRTPNETCKVRNAPLVRGGAACHAGFALVRIFVAL